MSDASNDIPTAPTPSQPVWQPPQAPQGGPASVPAVGTYLQNTTPTAPTRRRRGGLLLGLGCMLSAALGAGAVLVTRTDKADGYGLTEAQAATTAAGSLKLDMTISMSAVGTQMHVSGEIDSATKRMRMLVPLDKVVPGAQGSMETIVDGNLVQYVRYPRDLADLPPEVWGKWVRIDLAEVMKQSGADMSTIWQSDPLSSLGTFDPNVPAEDLGFEELDGVRVRHYRPQYDEAVLRQQYSGAGMDDPQLIEKLVQLNLSARVDVWVDADSLVRRMTITMDMEPVTPGAGTIDVDMRLSAFGEPVDIQLPPADQVMEFSDLIDI